MNEIIVNLIKKTIFKEYPQIESVTVEDIKGPMSPEKYIGRLNSGVGNTNDYYVSFTIEPNEKLSASQRLSIRREVEMFYEMLGVDSKSRIYIYFKGPNPSRTPTIDMEGPELI